MATPNRDGPLFWYAGHRTVGGTFSVDLSAMASPRKLSVEWFNPAAGKAIHSEPVEAGRRRSFAPPFSGDAVLYLVDAAGHQ